MLLLLFYHLDPNQILRMRWYSPSAFQNETSYLSHCTLEVIKVKVPGADLRLELKSCGHPWKFQMNCHDFHLQYSAVAFSSHLFLYFNFSFTATLIEKHWLTRWWSACGLDVTGCCYKQWNVWLHTAVWLLGWSARMCSESSDRVIVGKYKQEMSQSSEFISRSF